jgi:hypothetical protein
MKTILSSALAGTLLATLAVAQPPRAAKFANGAHAYGVPHTTVEGPKSLKPSFLVYVITVGSQFGVVNLRDGSFVPIGPGLPQDPAIAVGGGLVPGLGTSLLTLGFSGNLEAIDPRTGVTTVVGPTGLGDCATLVSPCGPDSANLIGRLGQSFYATDFANNLYSVDPKTGAAKLIGPTGIPPLYPLIPFSSNSDGTLNVYAESLFSVRGKLYATFATATLNPETGAVQVVIPGALYEINHADGHTRLIAPTDSNLTSIVNVDDTIYGFDAATHEVVTLDVTTGQTTPVTEVMVDEFVPPPVIGGATPVPPVSRKDDDQK